jgi:hypothetical protein
LLGFPDRETRLDLFEDFFIGLAEIGGLGRRRLGLTFDVPHDVEKDLDRARKSAVAERLTSWVMIAWRLLTLRRPPFSVTITGSFSASLSSVAKFLAPDGRPRGLPD